VLERTAEGAIDWTNMRIVASASGRSTTGAMTSLEAMEGDARDQLGPAFEALARRLTIDRSHRAGDYFIGDAPVGGSAVADRLSGNLVGWEVYEARYFDSGGVELEAALSLQSWLRPLVVTLAGAPEAPARSGGATGLLIDARGSELRCAVAPEVLDEGGAHVYGIADMTRYATSLRSPVVYVSDPADPVAFKRAGESPLIVRGAAGSVATDIVLSSADAARVREAAATADFLALGMVVVVVGPAGG
jgi:hypothetical protein